MSTSTGDDNYTYDENGNMTQRVEEGVTYNQTFNAENRLVSVTVNNETTQFLYDGDGNMFKQVNPDTSVTIFIDGVYEEDRNSSGGSVTKTRTYYPAGGAMRVTTGSVSNVYYVLRDNLGSAMATVNSSGALVGQQRYYPFGAVRPIDGSGVNTDRTYTGQRDIASLGLMDYHARMYDAYLNRWIQPDTIIPSAANPQSWNRYAYVLNNPLIYSDPTGNSVDCGVGENCKSLVSDTLARKYNWHAHGRWSLKQLDTLSETGSAISTKVGGDDHLRRLFGVVDFDLEDMSDNGHGDAHHVSLRPGAAESGDTWTVAHELGHSLDGDYGWRLSKALEEVTGGYSWEFPISFGGPACLDQAARGCNKALYFYGGIPAKGSDWNFNPVEDFAESFAASVYPVEAKAFVEKFFKGDDRFAYNDYTTTTRGMYMSALVYLLSH